ncbi:Hypothetical_protein [Hexamita inflata]|uniref:Hypothetical_protein n=1 Tax=Hexamita inflata TaxID=28002 RepID=A0ABP1HHS5_9EUKA
MKCTGFGQCDTHLIPEGQRIRFQNLKVKASWSLLVCGSFKQRFQDSVALNLPSEIQLHLVRNLQKQTNFRSESRALSRGCCRPGVGATSVSVIYEWPFKRKQFDRKIGSSIITQKRKTKTNTGNNVKNRRIRSLTSSGPFGLGPSCRRAGWSLDQLASWILRWKDNYHNGQMWSVDAF